MKQIFFFISDEGYGHTIRQRAIINELLKIKKKIKIHVVTNKKILLLKEQFKKRIIYHPLHNLIETKKNKAGYLNLKGTKKMFLNWDKKKNRWIKYFQNNFPNINYIISDSVPQAFILAKKLKVKSCNISHFTWDWFLEVHYRDDKELMHIKKKIVKCYKEATNFLILPYTPRSIIKKFKKKSIKIELIINNFKKLQEKKKKKYNCLIMDNGTKSMAKLIEKSILFISNIENITFYVGVSTLSSKAITQIAKAKNIIPVYGLKKIHSKINFCDFVISRGGFNTITETLVLKKPAIYFSEINNLETASNIRMLKKDNLVDVINEKDWGKNIEKKINSFIKKKYIFLKSNITKKNFKSNGAHQAAKFIGNQI